MNKHSHYDEKLALPASYSRGKIGIVTITYNSALVLDDFLASLDVQLYTNFILIVVDNASTDGSVQKLHSYTTHERIVIANEDNVGVAKANNQGIRAAAEAGCEYVLLLNNDVDFESGLFKNLVQGLQEQQSSMAVPMIYFFQPRNRIWAAGGGFQPLKGFRNYHRGETEEDIGQFSAVCLIDYAPTCCVLITRETFAQIGLMDERYFVYSDDADFMFRARQNNLRLAFIPSAKLWHKVSSLTGGLQSDFTIYHAARGRALFLYKNLGRFNGWLWTMITDMLYIVRPMIGADTRHRCAEKRRGLRDGRAIALSPHEQIASSTRATSFTDR